MADAMSDVFCCVVIFFFCSSFHSRLHYKIEQKSFPFPIARKSKKKKKKRPGKVVYKKN